MFFPLLRYAHQAQNTKKSKDQSTVKNEKPDGLFQGSFFGEVKEIVKHIVPF